MAVFMLLVTLTPFQADKVEIFTEGSERVVQLIGNVVIENNDTRITCGEARISEARGSVRLLQDVKLRDRNGEVNAGSAIYYFNEERGYLSDSVTVSTPDEKIISDSLYYDGAHDSVEMYGNVLILDEKNSMSANGEAGWYNLAADEGFLSGNPKLEVARRDRAPITVYAKVFKLLTNESLFYGFDSVQALIDSITVVCDTFSYDLEEERGEMTQPVIREKNNELRGTRGDFRLRNKDIESVSVEEGESIYYTKEGSRNVVEGDTITITFTDGKATTISVKGSPKGVLSGKRSEESVGN
jgi:lipopolysaccharide export system protein LptA